MVAAEGDTQGLHFAILGPLEVRREGQLIDLKWPRLKGVLAVLLLEPNRVVATDRLLDELWGETATDAALHSLHVHVSELRKAIEPARAKGAAPEVLVSRRPGYVLSVGPGQVDADQFTEQAEAGRRALIDGAVTEAAQLLEASLRLWRGPALAEFIYAPFAQREAERLEGMRLDVVEDRLEAEMLLGRHVAAELESINQAHPLRERPWALRMRALYRAGRPAEALRTYQELRHFLAEEVGTEPSPGLRHLEAAIVAQDPDLDPSGPAASAVRTTLPPAPTAPLPRGRVTFVFARAPSAEHDRVREAVAKRGGVQVWTAGDVLLAAFGDAPSAVAASEEAVAELSDADGPRLGVHTGDAEPDGQTYTSIVVHEASRIAGLSRPGEILLSAATKDDLTAGDIDLHDAGIHELPDFIQPVQLYRVESPRLPSLPPLPITLRHNLPKTRTTFVGRQRDISEVEELLRTASRPVTLVGIGGGGKTRLAVEIARRGLDRYPGGVWWVDLAPTDEPDRVAGRIGETFRDAGAAVDATTLDDVAAFISDRPTLLVLDNCEHLFTACAFAVDQLMSACPVLSVLATSRRPLTASGEVVWSVEPLAVPAADVTDPGEISRYEGCRLFMERAQAAGGHVSTAETPGAVAAICRRVDGIPLALELAAARTSVLSPAEISRRLDTTFEFLGRQSARVPERHQTLQAMIGWSYSLLTPTEQTLLRRLAAFTGGAPTSAVDQVCMRPPLQTGASLDVLQALVDASLVVADTTGDESRYDLLMTVRSFCVEESAETDANDWAATLEAHTMWCLDHLDATVRGRMVPIDVLIGREEGNWRAVLSRLLEQQDGQRAARLAAMIYRWLWLQGQVTESRQLIERVLELDPPMDVYRARVLAMAGDFARMQGDLATARRYADDGVAAARASGDPHAIGAAVGSLGNVLVSEGDGDGALVAWAEAAALATEGGDISAAAAIRHNIGEVAYDAGRYTEAAEQAAAAVKGFRQAGLDDGRAIASALLAAAEVKLGDRDGARRHIDEALALVAGRGFDTVALPLLELTAILDATDGHYHRSARLLGHADSRRERIGLPRTDDTVPVAELRATLIAHLGAEAERCLQEGAALSSDAAVELARSGLGNVTE